MKKIELKIGNFVSVDGTPVEVCAITKSKIGYHRNGNMSRLDYALLKDVKPIPLSEEVLLKNGWEKLPIDVMGLYTRQGEHLVIVYYKDEWTACIASIEPVFSLSLPRIGSCPYIHQLQQLLQLMDLKVKIDL